VHDVKSQERELRGKQKHMTRNWRCFSKFKRTAAAWAHIPGADLQLFINHKQNTTRAF